MVTLKFNNVFIAASAAVGADKEAAGIVGPYLDKKYKDLYAKEKTYEKAEIKMISDLIDILKEKGGIPEIVVGGDLSNQIASSNIAMSRQASSFVGIYGACANSALSTLIAALLIESSSCNSALAFAASHYGLSERQYRYFIEYAVQRRDTYTYTATGAAGVILKRSGDIKVCAATIGQVLDWQFKDVEDMGQAMAPAAYQTIKEHLKNNNITSDYYDLIVTGDLSKYGLELLKKIASEDNFDLGNINDCGMMLFDGVNGTYAGGSGCASSALVTFSYIFAKMRSGEYRRVLLVATGALMSPVTAGQKISIPVIAHAVSFEVVS